MIKDICQWILYKRMGWKKEITIDFPKKYIICLAPHTSNWDFLIGQLYSRAENIKSNFLMKKEWFFWPLGPIFRKMGGIPVWRSKHTSMTDNLAEEARKRDHWQREPGGLRVQRLRPERHPGASCDRAARFCRAGRLQGRFCRGCRRCRAGNALPRAERRHRLGIPGGGAGRQALHHRGTGTFQPFYL